MTRTVRTGLVFAGLMLVAGPLGLLAEDLARTQPARSPIVRSDVERSALDASDQRRAEIWELSIDEWQRYQTLMEGIRGTVSVERISPVEVLGIHARDEAERRRYAEMWARMMHDDTERVLAFEQAYLAAWARLYPGASIVDLGGLGAGSAVQEPIPAMELGDRLMMFVGPDCRVCDLALPTAIERIRTSAGVGLDLYLVGAGDDEAVRAWAQERRIPAELVRRRQITLNHDAGLLARFGGAPEDLPLLVLRRGNDYTVVAPDAMKR